jgi:hypothetical protein
MGRASHHAFSKEALEETEIYVESGSGTQRLKVR